MKIKFLQLNVNRSRASHDLLKVLAQKMKTDVLLISEPNRNLAAREGWKTDVACDAAMCILTKGIQPISDGNGRGFVWAEFPDVVVISVYTSPNDPIDTFEDTLEDLSRLMHHRRKPVLIGGDLNARAATWDREGENARGRILEEWMASYGLHLLNEDKTPAWTRGRSSSVLDLTLVTGGFACRVSEWKVLEEEILSDQPNRLQRWSGPAFGIKNSETWLEVR